jgi:hypothetical protein
MAWRRKPHQTAAAEDYFFFSFLVTATVTTPAHELDSIIMMMM